MKIFFGPGMRLLGLFGPLGRALFVVIAIAVALGVALGYRESPWSSGAAIAVGALAA